MQQNRKPEVLINTSSWINIFEIGLNTYLIENFNINTTPKVVAEIKEGEDFSSDAKTFKNYIEQKSIHVLNVNDVPDKIKHEISISSGEIELASVAFNEKNFIVLIDDARVYRVLKRVGIKYISSVHIVIDACLNNTIDKATAFKMLDKLSISISDAAIKKAKDVIIKWKSK